MIKQNIIEISKTVLSVMMMNTTSLLPSHKRKLFIKIPAGKIYLLQPSRIMSLN